MTTLERIAVYSGLAVALGLGLASQQSGRVAHAEQGAAMAGEFKLATVDVLAVIARKLESAEYKQANTVNAEKYDSQLRGMLKELEDIRTRALSMAEGTEPRKALEAEFMQKNQKFEESRATAQQAVESFNTQQVAEAYRLIVEAANGMAQSRGYSHVIVTRGDQVKIASQSVAGAVQEILARPVIRGVPADDLTEAIIAQMNLQNVVLPADANMTPVAPAAPAEQPK